MSTPSPTSTPTSAARTNSRGDGPTKRRVVIVGGGFAGLAAAKSIAAVPGVDVLLVDRRNHHLFQPLLYQVAMAGLSPAEIAAPIRSLLSRWRNVRVIQGEVARVDLPGRRVLGDFGEAAYDTLVLACGAQHSYFGHEEWEAHAPGLKTLEQATEIRRRVLVAYEMAEREPDEKKRRELLTFVIVGGGPTGVELAGAIGEMSRFTLGHDFRNIDPALTRIILIEAGKRILPSFAEHLSSRATRDLEKLGVQVWTNAAVTNVDAEGVDVGDERIQARTVLWAAGVRASDVGKSLGVSLDRQQRVMVGPDLSIAGHPEVFVLGDQAHFEQTPGGAPLPGVAPVATQQGRFLGTVIRADVQGRPRPNFRYVDKGQMATIGRRRAVVQTGGFWLAGFTAWLAWMFVHIYYLTGFKNRVFVLFQWAWSYFTFRRGARLIVDKSWRSYPRAVSSADGPMPAAAEASAHASIPAPPALHTATGTYPSVRSPSSAS